MSNLGFGAAARLAVIKALILMMAITAVGPVGVLAMVTSTQNINNLEIGGRGANRGLNNFSNIPFAIRISQYYKLP